MANRLPSLRGIETFLCVAEVLNFRRASERLNVTVSAISHRIQALEQDLGFLLFDRGQRRLRLTDDGAALLDRLRPGVRMLQEATMVARERRARPLLRIAAPPSFNGWLVPRLGEFQALHPDLRIELLSSGRRRAAGVDVSIVPMTAIAIRGSAEPLVSVRVTPVCSPAFLQAYTVKRPADLLRVPLIDIVPNHKGWNEWFRAAGIEEEVPQPALTVDDQLLLNIAVLEGRGVAIGMRALVAQFVADGRMVEPFSISFEFGPPLAILANENGNIRVGRDFAAWLRETLLQMPENFSTPVLKI